MEGWRLETDSVVDAARVWCPELGLEKRAAVGTGDERTVLGDDPAVPHQDLSHLCHRAHLVNHLDQLVRFGDGVGVLLWNCVGVDLLH